MSYGLKLHAWVQHGQGKSDFLLFPIDFFPLNMLMLCQVRVCASFDYMFRDTTLSLTLTIMNFFFLVNDRYEYWILYIAVWALGLAHFNEFPPLIKKKIGIRNK